MMQTQSLLSLLMRARMGVYETRLFMRIVEKCQCLLPSNQFAAVPYAVPGGWSYQFAFPLSSLSESHNYIYIKKACQHLKDITVQRYNYDNKRWMMAGLITQARIDEHSGILKVEVADWVCQTIIDFRKGWRSYDIAQAMRIRNPFSLRMYLLTCTQSTTLRFPLPYLRDLLLGENSTAYTNNGDFIRRCIAPADKELQKLGLNGYSYKLEKEDGTNRGKIKAVIISPIKREGKDTKNISETKKDIQAAIPETLMQYLTLQCGLSLREMSGRNLAKLQRFASLPDWQIKLISITTRWRKHRYGHGWLINAIDNEGKKGNIQ